MVKLGAMETWPDFPKLVRSESEADRGRAAAHFAVPVGLQEQLSEDKSEWVREQLAGNPALKDTIRINMARKETSFSVAKVLVSEADPLLRKAVWEHALESSVGDALRTWKNRRKLCPTPEKIRYRTLTDVIAAGDSQPYGVPMFHYECLCGVWHKTKSPQRV